MIRKPSKSAPQPQLAESSIWQRPWVVPVLLAVVVLATFADALEGKLVLDNYSIIAKDTRLQHFTSENLYVIATRNYWWPTFESDLYRPLTTFSYLINYCFFGNGTQPDAYHLVNLVLHWLNAWLVYLLATRYLAHRAVALVLTLVFAVHPLTIEAVTNIIGRADLFAALFMLAALELHARLREGSTSRRFGRDPARRQRMRFGLGLCALLGVLSKESGVVLIALMLLDDLSQPSAAAGTLPAAGRIAAIGSWFRRLPWQNYACVLPSLVVLFTARYELLKTSPVTHQLAIDNPMALAGFWTQEMTAIKVLGYYFKLTFWPAALSCDYSFNQIPLFGWTFSGPDLDAWLALGLVLLLTAAALVCWRRRPAVFFFLGFAFITLLPVSNLVITIGTIMGERFMYLPLVGLLGATASALEWGAARASLATAVQSERNQRIAAGVATAVIVALAIRTAVRNLDWYDNIRLWRSAVQVCPNSFKAYKGLATSLSATLTKPHNDQRPKSDEADLALLDECIRLGEQALELVDQEQRPLEHSPNGVLCDLARYYTEKGDRLRDSGASRSTVIAWYDKAEDILRRAMHADQAVNAVARRGSLARGMSPGDYHDVGLADIYEIQGQLCLRLKRFDQAEEACRWLVRLKAGDPRPFLLWADICVAQNHLEDAAVHLIQASILGEGNPKTWQTLEQIYSVLLPGTRVVINLGDDSVPMVRQQVNQAFEELIKDLLDGNYRDEANHLRQIAIDHYHCPPEPLAELFEQPAEAK